MFVIADSLGPIVGGFLAESGRWRWIFLFNAPFGPVITNILVFAVKFRTAKINQPLRMAIQKIDVLGMSSLIASLTLLIVALNIGGDAYPWASKIIIGLFVGSGCAFCSFVAAENFATFPVVPMGLFASLKWRNVPIMTIARCLLFFHLYATTFYVLSNRTYFSAGRSTSHSLPPGGCGIQHHHQQYSLQIRLDQASTHGISSCPSSRNGLDVDSE